MNAALVIMAAGLGSRYGGSVKQIERVGPGGEILMEYAIYDALRAGFDRIVVIIKPEMLSEVKEVFGDRVERSAGIRIDYAFQSTEGFWRGIRIPAGRRKPLGTVHALLSASEVLDRPFAVMNADDFYGRDAIANLGAAVASLKSGREAVMAAYRLENTVSPFGAVTRGVCAVVDGTLRKVTETYRIRLCPDGAIRDASGGEDGPVLAPETPVSMNLWGFHPGILERMSDRFERFLQKLSPEDDRSECLLPVVMDEFIAAGAADCRVLYTDDHWFGLTYREDKENVVAELKKLHDNGVYPETLWSDT